MSLLYNGCRVFLAGKAAGVWCGPATPSSTEAKERIELYLYSPTGLSGLFEGELYPYLYLYTYIYIYIPVHVRLPLLPYGPSWSVRG